MSDDFVIYMIVSLASFFMGVFAGFKLGHAYGVRVAEGFSLTDWLKSLLPFGGLL